MTPAPGTPFASKRAVRAAALLLLLILGSHVAFMVSPLHGHQATWTAAFAETGQREEPAHHLTGSHAATANATLGEIGQGVSTTAPGRAAATPITPTVGSEHCPIAPAPLPRWEAGAMAEAAVALLWAPPADARTPELAAIVPHPPDSPRLHARLGVFLN